MWKSAVTFVNARVVMPEGTASSVRFAARVLAIDEPPRSGDAVVDLEGAFVFPGLINAHDHLELNHYGLLKRRDRYENAGAWIDDLRPALQEDPSIRNGSAHALTARLFIGGLKNLLAGVTLVAHHNPRYRQIGRSFPVRVLQRYGWAHSLQMEEQPVGASGERGGRVVDRCKATPRTAPFMVHAGEGIDEAAQREVGVLQAAGCLRTNTVLVHGVAMSAHDWERLLEAGAALVWCPASNVFLFRRTADVRTFLDAGAAAWQHLCLGSDSRVTGARDLLDEMRVAAAVAPVSARELVRMVTGAAAGILRVKDAGRIAVGLPADLIVVPALKNDAAESLLAAKRRDLQLVVIGGRPRVGAPSLFRVFTARHATARRLVVDGMDRLAETSLARAIARCPIAEPGIECEP